MPDLIEDAQFETLMRRPWHVPGAHERAEFSFVGNTCADSGRYAVSVEEHLQRADDVRDFGASDDEELMALTAGEALRFWGAVVAITGLVVGALGWLWWTLS
jgi:hypothetical protein